ncbi:MAG: dTDP-4-dehydrorhamnose reductase [Bacteroidetes bacterium]|nr:MAG: dTDP-4-dehydrorhamnose reductase [Bacteroidota bacterium]
MKKIAVTGSNGLLGQKLVYLLKARKDIELHALARGENRVREKNGYYFHSVDLTDKQQVQKTLDEIQPDVIINTAAMTNVDLCETEREQCWQINVKAVEYLVESAKKTNAHLIHLSTDFVFDGKNGPYKETDEPNPLSYYAESKLASEKIVQNSGLEKWAIVRTIIVYGVVDNMSRSNVVLWAKNALENKQSINVVDDQFRSPTLAEDLAMGCVLIADKGASGIYHISGDEIMSILDLVYKVADFYKLDKSLITPVKSETLNQPAKRPPKTGFILDKAKKELGYQPHSFVEGLKIVDEQLKNLQNS